MQCKKIQQYAKNNFTHQCRQKLKINNHKRSNVITTAARDAIALDIPMNSVAEILVLAGGSCGTMISAPGCTRG
jgi:hypothetical protein